MTEDQELIQNMISRGEHLVPEYMWGAVERYFVHRIEPGSFLMSLLCNDPVMSVLEKADHTNQENIYNWCKFLYNYVPSYSWGSKETVEKWLSNRN